MKFNDIDELLEQNKNFAYSFIKENRSFMPQAVMSVNGKIIPIVITEGGNTLKGVIERIEGLKRDLDWVIIMNEGYIDKGGKNRKEDIKKNYKHGSLEDRYLAGDKDIGWIFILQAHWREGEKFIKKMRLYDIRPVSLELVFQYETDEFGGYLVLNI
jgi:hypothetical protein